MQTTKTKTKSKFVPLVLATSKPYSKSNLPVHEVASYKCDCGHKGAVQASLDDPHCSKCGNVVTARITTSASAVRIENAGSAVSLECANTKCSAHNLMSTETAHLFGGTICCASCGEELAYNTDDLDDEDIDLDNDTGADDLADSYDDEDDSDSEDDATDSDEDEDEEESSLEDDDVDIEDLEESDVDEDEADGYLGGDSVTNDEGQEVDESDDEDDSALDGDAADLPDDQVLSKVKRTTVLSTLKPSDIETARIVQESDRLHLFVKDSCVATLSQTKDNNKVFGTKNHLRLIASSLDDKGVVETAKAFGFKLATYKVDKTKALEATVASMQAKSAKRVANKISEYSSVLQESLEIAALGFNRDAFASEVSHPIKDSVMDLLTGLGVDKVTAAFQVQEAFSRSGDAFVEALLNKAHEIAGYSPTVRSQLTSTFASLNPPVPNVKALASLDETDEDDFDLDEEACDSADSYLGGGQTTLARLDNPMKQSKNTVTASTSGNVAHQRSSGLFSKNTLSAFRK